MDFIDSHAHLGYFDEDIVEGLLLRAYDAGLRAIVNICTDAATYEKGLKYQQQFDKVKIYLTASATPHDVHTHGEAFFSVVQEAAAASKLVAIGETGLDYYYEHAPRDMQQQHLRRYIQLALQYDLPLVIHCRDAFHDFFTIWDEEGAQRGVLHCFTGTEEEAAECVRRGLYVSFSGIVTFPKSAALKAVAKSIPQERLLIETDSPFLAPQPLRGKQNEPAYLVHTAQVIAALRGMTLEECANVSWDNAQRLFRL